jgi:hypothetical protein
MNKDWKSRQDVQVKKNDDNYKTRISFSSMKLKKLSSTLKEIQM